MMKKLLFGLMVVAAVSVGRGATVVWDGGSGGGGTAWMVTNNWDPDGLPGPLDQVVFSAAGANAGTIGINFGATTNGVVEIAQLVNTSATSRSIENSSSTSNGVFRFSGGGMVVSNGASGTFRFRNGTAGGTMRMEITGDSEIFTGGGPVVFSNSISEVGGSWRLTKTGASALRLSASNNYSGGTVVFAGTAGQTTGALMLDRFDALGSGDVMFSNTTSITMLMFGEGSGSGTLPNNLVLPASLTTNRLVSSRTAGSVATLGGLISGGSAAAPILIENEVAGNRGQIRLANSNNTFRTARFILNNGGLVVDSDGALGDTNNTITFNLSSGTPDTGLIFGDNMTLSPSRTIKFTQQGRIDVQSFTVTIPGMVTNDTIINKWGSGTLNFDGRIVSGGSGSFINNGGTTVFNGSNSVSGPMTINTGVVVLGTTTHFPGITTLTIASNALFDGSALGGYTMNGSNRSLLGFGSVTGEMSLSSRARLSPGAAGTAGTLTFLNGLSQDGTVTNAFDLGGDPADTNAHDLVNVAGVLTAAGDVIVVNPISLISTNGSYRIFNCDTSSTPSFALAPLLNSRFTLALDTATPGQVNVQASGAAGALVWNGISSNYWDVMMTTNWLNSAGASNDVFFQNDDVTFDDTPGVQTNVVLAGVLTPNAVTVNSAANEYFLSGGTAGARIGGGGSIAKAGASLLSLALTNSDYSGMIMVTGGTLKPFTTNALGTAAGVTLVNGGTLDVNGLNIGSEPLMIGGDGLGGVGAVVNNGASQINALQYVTLVTNASIGGLTRWDIRAGSSPFLDLNGHTLTKVGTNQISIAAVRATNDGSIVVSQGVFSVESGVQLAGAGTVEVDGSGALNFLSQVTNQKTVVMNGGVFGTFLGGTATTNTSPVVLNTDSTFIAAGASITFAGPISGAGGIICTAGNATASSVILAGTNTFSGDVLVATGYLRLASSGALGASTNLTVISLYGGIGNTGTRVELANGISLGSGVTLTLPATLAGEIRSTFFNVTGTNTWEGTTQLTGDGNINIVAETTGNVFNITGPVVGPGFTGTVFFRGATGNGNLSGAVNLPIGTLSKPDNGTWTISSTGNVWSIAHLRGGTLRLAAPDALCTNTPFQFGLGAEVNNTILDLGGFRQTVGRVIASGAGGTKLLGNSSTNSDATFVVSGANGNSTNLCTIVDGLLGGTNRTGVTIENGANVLQSANSTYTGPTLISNATLRISTFNVTPLGKSVVTIDPTAVLECDSANGSRTLTNNLTGSGLIRKVSANNIVTRGSNDFSGPIQINAGYFVFDHVDSDNGAPALDFNGGNLAIPEMFATNPLTITSLSGTSTVSVIDPNYNTTGQTPVVRILLVNQTNDTSFAGSIRTGSGTADRNISLEKHGPGTLALLGTNTYGGPTLAAAGTLVIGGGLGTGLVTVVSGATLDAAGFINGPVNLSTGATLRGAGILNGLLTADGSIHPGASPGVLTVNGGYVQNPGSDLNIELGGLNFGTEYDQLSLVDGTLGGTLNVTLTNAYAPAASDTFGIVVASGTITGTFATTNLPGLGGGLGWDIQYFPNAVILSVVSNGAPPAGYTAYSNLHALALGETGDDDLDGYANLYEYVTGSNPTNPANGNALAAARTNGLFALKFLRDTNSTDATLIVEGAYGATNDADWIGFATNISGSWGSATNVIETGSSPVSVTAYDTEPAATNRFLRLRITRP